VPDRVQLPGGWQLWEQFALRGPGFPAAGVLRLAPDDLAFAADKFAIDSPLLGEEWDAFEDQFAEAMVNNARVLQQVAALPAFRTAVAWQNPALLSRAIDNFAGWTPTAAGRTSKRREREELIAHYWQRFCVKNDTIGFFGPVGWGRWEFAQRGVQVTPGSGLVAESNVYFSSWAIDALAQVIGTDPTLLEWVAPRRVAFIRVTGSTVSMPGRPGEQVSELLVAALRRCDGTRTPSELATAVSGDTGERISVDQLHAMLGELLNRRWITWRLEVPVCTHPERHLRAMLEKVTDPAVRQPALDKLAVLERGRDRIREAGTDADALSAAFTALENDFHRLTQVSAQREKNKRTAPCRSLIYSDSRRSATVQAGGTVLAGLAPLSLCLTAANWLTSRFTEEIGSRITEAYLRVRERQSTVDLASLWMQCLPVPHADSMAISDRLAEELCQRWARIIDAPPGARQVRRSSAEISDRVQAEFGAHGKVWPLARYYCPDVMIIASDTAAVARGEFELLLGELHMAMNTISWALWVMQHPDPDSLLAETSVDFPGPRLLTMLPKEQPPRWSTRSRISLDRPEDYHVAMVHYTGDPHQPGNVLSADVLVEQRDGELVAVLPDGSEYDVLDVYGQAMTQRVMDRFGLLPAAEHSPRVTVDRMILARETWRFTPDQLPFATETNEARRYVTARHWREQHQLPRHIFLTSATEPRPCYIDFDAPTYINILAKAARRLARHNPTAHLTITEMLPAPDQTWLTDDQHNRYTAELRFVAVAPPYSADDDLAPGSER
jgi:hypothetical protein